MSNVKEMTVHAALRELKTLNKKIPQYINKFNPCAGVLACSEVIEQKTKKQWLEDTKAAYQQITDLIRYRDAIKQAVSESNAKTKIRIDSLDKEISIAAAIDMQKYGLEHYTALIEKMRTHLGVIIKFVESANQKADQEASRQAQTMYNGKETNVTKEVAALAENTRKTYYETHKYEILDPISVETEMNKLIEFYDTIKTEIDSKISIANATTIITVEF